MWRGRSHKLDIENHFFGPDTFDSSSRKDKKVTEVGQMKSFLANGY